MRGLKTTVFGIITVSVDVRIVNLFVFLAIYISWFISKFHRLHIRALCNFFGQEDRRPPKSECARTPMFVRVLLRDEKDPPSVVPVRK